MTDLMHMSPEEQFEQLSHQMRMANTARMKQILDALEPYVDGSLGPVSPAHVQVYLKTCRELGLLWGAYTKPAPPAPDKGEDTEPMVLSARQEAVLAELGKLREVGTKNQGRRVS
jgi:hypothetical protein